ncbi:amidohydrolase family protein [Planctomycetota bacterium]
MKQKTFHVSWLLLFFMLVMVSFLQARPHSVHADLILTGGKVYTMEADCPWASGIVITGNKITAVLPGGDAIEFWQGPETRVIDLRGQFVVPGFIDGIMGDHSALFYEPYNDRPGYCGHYRPHTSDDPEHKVPNMDKMYNLIKLGYSAGFVSNVHAIGTKGVCLMLDTYERLMKDLGRDLDGFRVIHAQVVRAQDLPRFKQLNVIAEVNPYHISDDMRWMEERIGRERCQGAYAFQSLLDNGAILSFGSDWPGTMAAEYHMHPKYLIHAAVNRTTVKGEPVGGWFPKEKISMHEALKAFTINNAYAAFNADTRGSIKTGKLADIVVCDRNLMTIDPRDVLKMNVTMTIVDGKVVYEKIKE